METEGEPPNPRMHAGYWAKIKQAKAFKKPFDKKTGTPPHENNHYNTLSKQTPIYNRRRCARNNWNYLPLSVLSILFLILNHLLHEADVVEFGKITVLEQVWTFMLWHSLYQMFDDFVGDE